MKTVIEMAREAGVWGAFMGEPEDLERFAALVIANHPPQSYMTWQEGFAAGKQAEREACAKACEETYTGEEACGDWPTPEMCAAAIRARSNT